MFDKVFDYFAIFLALLIVLPFHEFAHAFVAVKSGDDTPKIYKRYTLNPFAHFDPYGLLFFVVAGFGWAKPVPVNPFNFRHYKRDCFFVAIAGVITNYLIAFFVYPLLLLSLNLPMEKFYFQILQMFLFYVFQMSLSFFVFNLIPIYPLDGFRVLDSFVKRKNNLYYFLKNKGSYVLYGLFALSIIADYSGFWQLDILGIIMSYCVGFISKPIILFWGLVF